MKLFTRIAATTGLLTLGNCTNLPPARLAGPDVSSFLPSRSTVIAATGHRELHATIDVLTFNIEGLGWPARRGRAAQLRRIGTLLERLNAAGEAPDVIMVQEMFSPAAVRAVTRAGYGYRAWGPSRTTRRRMPVGERVGGPYYRSKGEVGFHLVGSGLAVLSRYPIVATSSEPFGSSHCARFDCLRVRTR